MGYVLGIDLGTSRTAAAVFRNGRADIVPLSDHAATMPSMVFVRDDAGGLLVGDAARRRGQEDPIRLAREFKRRFGDATPLVLGSSRFTAEELTAVMLRHVVDFVAQREGGRPDQVVVAHPANWGEYRRELLRREVTRADLPPARMVSEPDAAAVHFASGERMKAGDVIAVYDLGGGTFDAAVLRRTATGFEQIGEPKGIERLGGVDFDEAVLADVISQSGLDAAALTDADTPALVRLRDDCQDAKEALSDDLEATVPVNVGSINTRVKITRTHFEQMVRPPLRSAAQTLRTAVFDAGLQLDQVSAVLMVGGSSRIPLAATLVREELRLPVVFTSNPKEAVALGAARIGAGPTATAVDAPPVPPPPPVVVPHTPVVPPPPPPITTTRTPMRPTPPPAAPPVAPPTAPPTRRRWWLVAVAAVVAIGIGVGAGIAVSGNDDNVTPTTDETVVSTDETTPDSTATDEDTSPQQTDATIAPVVTAGS